MELQILHAGKEHFYGQELVKNIDFRFFYCVVTDLWRTSSSRPHFRAGGSLVSDCLVIRMCHVLNPIGVECILSGCDNWCRNGEAQ